MKVIIEIRDGVVQSVYATDKSIQVEVLDWNEAQEADPENFVKMERLKNEIKTMRRIK